MPRPSTKKVELGPPPRWLKCPRHGKIIAGKFIPMKTPLCDAYDDQVPETCRFYVPMVFNVFKNHGKIGFWIDLTNTDRFYDKDDVEKCGATYYKLLCKGHGECPSEDKTRLFIHACKVFIKNNPDSLIAVHCTHGFNRTGFLIAAYLIEEKSWSAEAVVQAFAESRPPGIYKQDYLEELFKRYDDVKEAPLAPALPEWCDESDAILNDQEAESSQPRMSSKTGVTCVEGVPCAKIVTDPSKVRQVRQKCSQFCRWNRNGFPGSQPVSMDTNNIRFLEQKNYEVTWKADGVRYMMLILCENEVYMIDRDNNVFLVPNMRFPYKKDLTQHLKDTLLDGELIFDEINGQKVGRYLIYDIIHFKENPVGDCDFARRTLCINLEIIQPRQRATADGLINRSSEPFSVRAKEFWDITQVDNILSSKFSSSVTHEIDGLIFQPQSDRYEPGRCQSLLKWKPHHLNSIDFKLKIVRIHKEGMLPEYVGCLYVLHLQEPYAKMKVTKDLKQYDNKIIECSLENGEWKFMRERRDKSFPNAFDTAEGVMRSIKDPITKERLIEFVRKRAKKPRGSQKRSYNGHESVPGNKVAPMLPPDSRPPEKLTKNGTESSVNSS